MPNANTTNIRIRKSYANSAPANLENSEIAYSFVSDKFFIGNNTNHIFTIGGAYYTNIVDSANSVNIPSTLVKRNNQGRVDLGQITTNYYPTTNIDVVSKGYVDNVLAASHGSIYFENYGNTGYSNAIATSEGINITANNKQIARFRNDMIYLDEDVSVLNNIYLHDVISTGNLQSQNIITLEKFFAGIATALATQLPNTIAQFTGNTSSYVQINAQNINRDGSSDYVATADVGTDTTFYIDTGIQGSNLSQGALKPLDGYLLVQGNTGQPGGNLIIGTISATPTLQTKFVVGGFDDSNIIMALNSQGIKVTGAVTATTLVSPTIDTINAHISGANGYVDTANSYNQNYTNAANTWLQANDRTTLTSAQNYTDTANTWLQANTGAALAAAKVYTDTANTWLQANTGVALAVSKDYTNTANIFLQANTGVALANAKSYTDAANTFLQANDRTTLTTSKSYTDNANTWLQANDRTTLTLAQNYTDTTNTFLQANTGSSLAVAKAYTDTANTWLQANDKSTLTTSKSYTDTANTWLQANTGAALAAGKVYTDSIRVSIENEINANLTTAINYTNTANAFLQANDSITLGIALNYTDVAYNFLKGNDYTTLLSSKSYTDSANTWLQSAYKANDYLTWITSQSYTDASRVAIENEIGANLATAKAYTDTANSYNKNYTDTANSYNQTYTNTANTWLQANNYLTWTTSQTYTNTANTWLQANDKSTLTTSKAYTDTANTFLQANTGAALAAGKVYTDTANTFLQANTGAALAAGKVYTDTANTWLQANDYLTWITSQTYTNTANTFLQANTKAYTDAANTWLQANTGAALAVAKAYTDTANSNLKLYAEANTGAALAAGKVYTDTANTYLNNKKVDRSGDTINGTLIINNTGSSAALQVSGNVTISKDLTVTGNLAVLGNSTILTTASLELTDSLIMLAVGNYISDAVDIGIIGHYNAGTNAHSGIIRDPAIKEWIFFDGYTPEVSANNLINISDPSFNKSNINSNYFKGNLIGTSATVNGIELYNYSTASYAQANTTTQVANYAANKANSVVQNGFVNITANGTTSTATTNTDTLIFTSAVANGINILNPSTKTIDLGLRNSGVVSGTYSYPSMTVDSFGRTTSISNQTPVTTFNTRNGAVTLNYSDVITSLGYYPLSNTGNTISGSYTGATNIGTTTVTLGNVAVTSNSYTTSGTTQIILDSWPIATYRSAKYQIQIVSGSQYHVLEIRSLHDGTNSWINQFGEIITNQPLGLFTTSISGGNYNLLFTPHYSPTTIKLLRDIINI